MDELHTDREYELEKQLWDTLTVIQQYLLSIGEGSANYDRRYANKLRELVFQWMDDPHKYLQHPKWKEPVKEATR